MSADNGIYIGRFPTNERDVYEYRVIHAMAIENCEYSEDFPKEMTDAYIASYFADVKPISSKDEAYDIAAKMAENEPILEYGISEMTFSSPISMTSKEAGLWLEAFWTGREAVRSQQKRIEIYEVTHQSGHHISRTTSAFYADLNSAQIAQKSLLENGGTCTIAQRKALLIDGRVYIQAEVKECVGDAIEIAEWMLS